MNNDELFKRAKQFIPGLTIFTKKNGYAREYLFKIKTRLGTYSGKFTDSICNYLNGFDVNIDDVLNSWLLDANCYENYPNFIDFCQAFAYEIYDKDENQKAKKSFRGCQKAYNKLQQLLTTEQIEKLQELFEKY